MAKKIIWCGILVFAMAVVGCDIPADEDIWSDITNLNLLNGTWEGVHTETMTIREFIELNNLPWTPEMQLVIGNTRVTMNNEITANVNVDSRTVDLSGISTAAFSGGNVDFVWYIIRNFYPDSPGITLDDANRSIEWQWESPTEVFSESEITEILNSGLKINQNGSKILIPAGFMGSSSEIIMTKK